jgi:hypothetical protein
MGSNIFMVPYIVTTEGRQEVYRLEEEFDKDAVYHQFCSTCTANALPRKLWMGTETSK